MIFQSTREDFIKIFAATFAVFVLMMTTDILSSSAFILVTIYFLDGGHVYSTLLETLADPEEIKKQYVWWVLLGSFLLNTLVHFIFTPFFFFYIFYFTIFHNMRQGLGVTFLYRIGDKASAAMVKWSYYFLTCVPFFLFHLRPPLAVEGLGEAIIKPIDLTLVATQTTLDSWFTYGLIFYGIGSAVIALMLIKFKNLRGFLSMLFFTAVYVFAFIISDNQMQSYALLIFSHALPYFFLMEKRLVLTHKIPFIKKYAFLFVALLFLMGAIVDYYQFDVVEAAEPFESLAMGLLTTPLIAHFIFDAIIWKRDNARFKSFITNQPL